MFGLWMNGWSAGNLGCGSLQNPDLEPFGKAKHVDCAGNARFCRLYRVPLIVNWRGRASKVGDLVHFDKKRKCHIVAEQFEASVIEQVFDIAAPSRKEIVNAK